MIKKKRWMQNVIMLGPRMLFLLKIYDFRFFSINLVNFFLHTSVRILVPNVSRWETYFVYLSPKCLCKESIDKMHEVLILDVCFDA